MPWYSGGKSRLTNSNKCFPETFWYQITELKVKINIGQVSGVNCQKKVIFLYQFLERHQDTHILPERMCFWETPCLTETVCGIGRSWVRLVDSGSGGLGGGSGARGIPSWQQRSSQGSDPWSSASHQLFSQFALKDT